MQVLTVSDFFSCIAENCQKKVSLTIVGSSKNILSGYTNNKKELGSMMFAGLPGEAVESTSG